MPRSIDDVPLPDSIPRGRKLRRAKAGHVIYPVGAHSVCPRHQFCAYTGSERNRCSVCHSSEHLTVDHDDLPPGRLAPCFCDYCGELFTSISAFSDHQMPAGVCRNPERRKLVLIDSNGWFMWGKPGSPPPRD